MSVIEHYPYDENELTIVPDYDYPGEYLTWGSVAISAETAGSSALSAKSFDDLPEGAIITGYDHDGVIYINPKEPYD